MMSKLHYANKQAIKLILNDDPFNASYWFLECAAISIRRGGQDVIAADAAEVLQNFMSDDVSETADVDRLILRRILGFYDDCYPEKPALTVVV